MSFLTSFKKKKNKTTRRAKPDARKFNLKKWIGGLFILAVLIWLGLIALAADLPGRTADWIVNGFYTVTAKAGFTLDQIEVTGRTYTDTEALRKIVRVDQGESLFAIDLEQVHGDILNLPWVTAASLQRQWPNLLSIHLTERTPIALWQHNGKLSVLDSTGTPVETPMLEEFSYLPIVTGADAPTHTAELLEMVAAEDVIAEQFDSAVRLGDRRWDIKLKNGLIIKLPEDDVPFALARVAEAEKDFLIFSKEILSLDARFSDRLIVKASSGAASRLSDHLQSTQSNDTPSVSP